MSEMFLLENTNGGNESDGNMFIGFTRLSRFSYNVSSPRLLYLLSCPDQIILGE